MKILQIFIVLIIVSGLSIAQRANAPIKLDVSLETGIGTSFIRNRNINNDYDVSVSYLNISYLAGVKVGCTLYNQYKLSFEASYYKANQEYGLFNAGQDLNLSYRKKLVFNSLEFASLLKYITQPGIYVEGGVKFSNIYNITTKNLPDGQPDNIDSIKFNDINQNAYIKFAPALAAGFGLIVKSLMNERLQISIGTRGYFGFRDIIKGENNIIVKDGIYDYNPNFHNNYGQRSNSYFYSMNLIIEVNYFFGYLHRGFGGKRKIKF